MAFKDESLDKEIEQTQTEVKKRGRPAKGA
jgi:hypothetical protein